VNRLQSIGLAIGVSLFCVAAAQSMPFAPIDQAQTSLTIPVAAKELRRSNGLDI
jgi:hypothetical protein